MRPPRARRRPLPRPISWLRSTRRQARLLPSPSRAPPTPRRVPCFSWQVATPGAGSTDRGQLLVFLEDRGKQVAFFGDASDHGADGEAVGGQAGVVELVPGDGGRHGGGQRRPGAVRGHQRLVYGVLGVVEPG